MLSDQVGFSMKVWGFKTSCRSMALTWMTGVEKLWESCGVRSYCKRGELKDVGPMRFVFVV